MMSYRKPKVESSRQAKWQSFLEANGGMFVDTGLPLSYYEKHEIFDDFLMHGCIDHHEDPIGFTTDRMTTQQLNKLKLLVREYFKAGFTDPGIIVFSQEVKDQLKRDFSRGICLT